MRPDTDVRGGQVAGTSIFAAAENADVIHLNGKVLTVDAQRHATLEQLGSRPESPASPPSQNRFAPL